VTNQNSIQYVHFPSLNNASDDGLLAMGGNLSLDTLISAYQQGIFPWFNKDQPILWWSPDPRLVLYPEQVNVSRSLKKRLRKKQYTVSCDEAFDDVIKGCSIRGLDKPLDSQADTWITSSMLDAYSDLHQSNYAHSIEVWQGEHLAGGLYGIVLGKVFFGESMFSNQTDASKVALVALCKWLLKNQFSMIDCQIASDHLFSMGAVEIPRSDFVAHLDNIDINQNSANFSTGFKQYFSETAIYDV